MARLLDLFCGAGGCSVGYHRAGFDVVGVDIEAHDDYPYELIVADAMDVLADRAYLDTFDVVHASPPCPRYSIATPEAHRDSHPDLLAPTITALRAWGGTWVVENVPGARGSESPYGVTGDGPEPRDYDRNGRKARSVAHAREVMGIDWMTRWDDLADAIPPAYTAHIGHQLLEHLERGAA